jgi:hypothetical protein
VDSRYRVEQITFYRHRQWIQIQINLSNVMTFYALINLCTATPGGNAEEAEDLPGGEEDYLRDIFGEGGAVGVALALGRTYVHHRALRTGPWLFQEGVRTFGDHIVKIGERF